MIYCRALEVGEGKNQDLCGYHSQEHCERIYGRVGYSRSIVVGSLVAVGECWRVGIATGEKTEDREIIQLVATAGDATYDKQRNESDEETIEYPLCTGRVEHSANKVLAGPYSH